MDSPTSDDPREVFHQTQKRIQEELREYRRRDNVLSDENWADGYYLM